jgi:hypothetical protein
MTFRSRQSGEKASAAALEEGSEVVGDVVNVLMGVVAPQFPGGALLMGEPRPGDDLDRRHADGVGDAQILFEVVEHDGARRFDPVGGEEIAIRDFERLGLVSGGLDVEDGFEQIARAQPGEVKMNLRPGSAAIASTSWGWAMTGE